MDLTATAAMLSLDITNTRVGTSRTPALECEHASILCVRAESTHVHKESPSNFPGDSFPGVFHVALLRSANGESVWCGLLAAAPGPGDVPRGADEEQEGSADEKLK